MLAGGRLATGVLEVTDDPAVLDRGGFWAVAMDFEGALRCVRFADVRPAPRRGGGGGGPPPAAATRGLSAVIRLSRTDSERHGSR
ncbi:anthranilate synthase component I family protein, partial [Frankia sp. Ag45/Mut15]|nr:anthranilate synthase component I family protein [Frankia umida]